MSTRDFTLTTRHADIRVRQSAGLGMPLVMIHGSGASKDVFARQFDSPMADCYRMIALDLPGHGQSSDAFDPELGYTIAGLAETVSDLLRQMKILRCVVFGWSLGGHVAIELMADSDRVAGLMLTGAPPAPPGPLGTLRAFKMNPELLLASKENFTERDVERFAKLCYGPALQPQFIESIRRADGRLRAIFFKSMLRGVGADQRMVVENARVPVGIVNGEYEPFARQGFLSSLNYKFLWDDHCHVLADIGHAPFLEAPEIFNSMLDRFMDDVLLHEMSSEGAKVEPEVPAVEPDIRRRSA